MRVSRPTVVFAVVACVAFGLAIRDTLKDQEASPEPIAEVSEARARAAAAARESELAFEERTARRKRLFEAEPAALGGELYTALDARDADPVRTVVDGLEVDLWIVVVGDETVRGIVFKAKPALACDTFAAELRAQWGAPHPGKLGPVWTSPTRPHRAALNELSCTLVVEWFAPATRWIDPTSHDAVVPMWALGATSAAFLEELRELQTVAQIDAMDDRISWSDLGLEAVGGSGPTMLLAHVKADRIVAITASTQASDGDLEPLVTRLESQLGPPVRTLGRLRWTKQKLLVELEHDQLVLTLGDVPQ